MNRAVAMLAIATLAVATPFLASCTTDTHGLGGTAAVWAVHHGNDVTPVVDGHGLVEGYTATFAPRPLADAVASVRAELPEDATATPPRAVAGIQGTKCEIVQFTSAKLGRLLGGRDGSHVMAAFETNAATSMDTNRISQVTVVSANQNIPYGC